MQNQATQHPLRDSTREALSHHLSESAFEHALSTLEADGFVVFESVMTTDQINAVRVALEPHFDHARRGRNDFEGFSTHREYALMGKGAIFPELATHPLALAFAEATVGASCLLSAFLAIQLYPGETVQPWHADDGHCHSPRPRAPLQCSAFWTIDETTPENGATEVIPGSHQWGDTNADRRLRSGQAHALQVAVPPGSLMIALGTLVHRGGANRSASPRLILTPQYCPGWVRPLESMLLSVPHEDARAMSERARELCGYSIHPPFMGYADGVHPAKYLNDRAQVREH
jgi:hypothetical protein